MNALRADRISVAPQALYGREPTEHQINLRRGVLELQRRRDEAQRCGTKLGGAG
jgi:hypothetical protein